MKRILALLIAVCCLCALCACSGGNNQQSTEDGAMIKITNDKGEIISYERRYHNDHGDIVRLDVYDKNEVYDHYIVYEYDDEYRILQETTYRADGIGDHYYSYTYDENGNLTEKGYYTMSDGAERTLYNPDGTAKERYTYDSSDTLIKHEICENGFWKNAPLEEPSEEPTEASTEAEKAE